MKIPRAGSRKFAVYTAWTDTSVEAAIKVGAELNLKPGTIRSWITAWAKANGATVTLPKGTISAPKAAKPGGGRRVREIGHPIERRGSIMAAGEQTSTVRWDNGDVRHVTNKYLISLKPDGTDDEDKKTDWQRREERSVATRRQHQ